jgi:hypothetical protein
MLQKQRLIIMRNKNKLVLVAFSLFSLAGLAQSVSAELYVSPVVRDSVKFDNTGPKDLSAPPQAAISGASTVHGDFVMKDKPESLSTVMRFGQNVPLFVAIEKVVPQSADWKINVDSGLENSIVNWEGGESWEDVISIIAKQNNLSIIINVDEKAIGISKDNRLATSLAMKSPQVWRLETNKTLRQNLEAWATKAGWKLEWDSRLNIDYPITNGAVLTGNFVGKDGVVDQVLYSLKKKQKPLRAEFHTLNNVLLITEAGFKQEVPY